MRPADAGAGVRRRGLSAGAVPGLDVSERLGEHLIGI
jgi:hypothetical protein